MNTPFDSVEAAIEDIRNGKMVIVTDDANRENEGDLVCAAEKVTPEDIVFMATHARGLICTPITEASANELGIARPPSTDMFHTAFTESVDSKIGTTTGISAFDRAKTAHDLIDPERKASDFAHPGHTFPIAARPGGVLQRTGHTEAAVDLARLAGIRHQQRDFVQRVAAENTLHAAQILPVHADKQVVSVVIRFSKLPRTVPASGQAMARKLPLRPRMHGIADFLRADRR